MSQKPRLPPSGRDFEAYQRVTIELQSTRQVARELKISQTRVCQIVVRVGEYLLQVAPASVSAEDRGRQVYLAQQIAAEQVQFFLRQALDGFERSIGKQTVVREVNAFGKPKTTVSTTKINHGDCRFLNQAARFALLGAKLPAPNLAGLLPEEADEDLKTADRAAAREWKEEQSVEAGHLPRSEDSRLQLRDESVASPPDEDCSPETAEEGDKVSEAEHNDDANPHYDDPSDILSDEEALAFHAEIRAHHAVQMRQEFLRRGIPEERMEEFLSSPYGQKAIRKYEEAMLGSEAGASAVAVGRAS
jgi:hypothetical protein